MGGFQPLAIAAGATAVAMQWFGGNPQYAFYGGIAVSLYLAGRLWQRREMGGRAAARILGSFGLIYVLGSVLAGVQLIPALELFSVSSRRGQLSYPWVAQDSFVPVSLLTIRAGLLRIGRRLALLGATATWRLGWRSSAWLGRAGQGAARRLHCAGLPAAGAGRSWAGAETALRARARLRPLPRVGAVPVPDERFPRAAGRHGRGRDRGDRRRGSARKPPIRASCHARFSYPARRRRACRGIPQGAAPRAHVEPGQHLLCR